MSALFELHVKRPVADNVKMDAAEIYLYYYYHYSCAMGDLAEHCSFSLGSQSVDGRAFFAS